jgi:ABC-type sugar transport system permease subunit
MSFSTSALFIEGFAGLRNYFRLFKNPMFKQAALNTLIWTVMTVTCSFALGFVEAVAINRTKVKYKGFWRSLIFIAWIIPGVVKATSWKWLYTTDGGMINHILQSLRIIRTPIPWLISQQYALFSVILVQIWACAPYVMLMITAGLQQLPKELYESSDIDGANWFTRLTKITFPLLKDISFICILLLFIWAINEFSLIWIITNGSQGTTTFALLVYNQFKVLNINSAAASAVIELILTMAFAVLYVKIILKEEI